MLLAEEILVEVREVARRLTRIECALTLQGRMLMDLASLITDLDTNTTAVAARLDKLIADLAAANGAAPTAAQLAELQALSAHLKAMGTDPAAPVPPLPPPATP